MTDTRPALQPDILGGVHPKLKRAVAGILAEMAANGHPMIVTDGVCDKTGHGLWVDGCGHAVDIAFVDAHGQPRWSDDNPWAQYGAAAKARFLTWGGAADRAHIEMATRF